MTLFLNLFIYLSELVTSIIYFNSNFTTKRKKPVIVAAYTLSFVLQSAVYQIESDLSLLFNLTAFFVCNMVILYTCYNVKLFQALFNIVLLEGIMLTSEVVVMAAVSAISNVELLQFKSNDIVLFIDSTATKVLYFLVTMLIAKIRNKRINKDKSNDFAMMLFILPLLSVCVIIIFGKMLTETQLSEETYWLSAVISALLMVANFIVFFVHERVVSVLHQNTEFQLEKQKTEISDEYYKELEYQYDQSHVLLHDIKRQLKNINDISVQENYPKVSDYISSIYDGYEIYSLKRYSSNKLLNIIASRYAHLCYEKDIEMFTDIKNVDLSFISDSDLTAITDNLLENAMESASNSAEKTVTLAIYKKNEQFVFVNVTNSCDTDPKIGDGDITTSKADKALHGYGLKSVKKAVKKYDGDIEFKYDRGRKSFSVILMFNTNFKRSV